MNQYKKYLTCLTVFSSLFFSFSQLLAASYSQVTFNETTFSALPGWRRADVVPSFEGLQNSCQVILSGTQTVPVGSRLLPLRLKDWRPACEAALAMNQPSNSEAKDFFKTWFVPVSVTDAGEQDGLFTGYYLPSIPASLHHSTEYNVPIYGTPRDLVSVKRCASCAWQYGRRRGRAGRVTLPYGATREQIDHGALKDRAPVVLWTKTRADRFFLQIQGSGIAELPDGRTVLLSYAGANGAPYYPIGCWFIDQNIMDKNDISMQKIYDWLCDHPKEADKLMNRNPSFVFFSVLNQKAALGTERAPLTPGYSLAIDNRVIPFGTPLWLVTQTPDPKHPSHWVDWKRLMIAQDTGGAIKGGVRGDIFFGDGEDAGVQAGYMRNQGRYWALLPKTFIKTLG